MENKELSTLSVIISNYNKGIYIQETIESILRQTVLPAEIIIVDDCSTDCSRAIAQKYAEQFPHLIKVFNFSENQGTQKARDFGIRNATSQYITCIDSDDFYYNKKKLENELRVAAPKK